MRSRCDGFTLVETVVTIAIVVLLSASATLALPPLIRSQQLNQGVTALAGAIREAQVRAVEGGQYWRVRLETTGYVMESALTSIADWEGCGISPDWTIDRQVELPDLIQIGLRSRDCITFGPSGRAEWPRLQIDISATTLPATGLPSLALLVDGWEVKPPPLDPTEGGIVRWNSDVDLAIDFQESRYLLEPCIGVFSYNYPALGIVINYPSAVSVRGSNDKVNWTDLSVDAIPSDVGTNRRERTCLKIHTNDSLRYLEITATKRGPLVAMDEVNASQLFVLVQGPTSSKILVVSPITGRVVIQ